jgi:hypothetical protein
LAFLRAGQSMAQDQEVLLEVLESPGTIGGIVEFKIIITGSPNYEVSDFPEFKGLSKSSQSIKHYSVKIMNRNVPKHIFSQVYENKNGGKINLPDLTVIVNGSPYTFKSKTINFPSENAKPSTLGTDDILLILESPKNSFYVGEGIPVKLVLQIPDQTNANWTFDDNFSEQVNRLSTNIRLKDAIENRKIFTEIPKSPIKIGNIGYQEFLLQKLVFYSLKSGSFTIPEQKISLIKTQGTKKQTVTFSSKNLSFTVKDLPEHPLKKSVAVGVFSMNDTYTGSRRKKTGASFPFVIKINGKGNPGSVVMKNEENSSQLDFQTDKSETKQEAGDENFSKNIRFKIMPKTEGSIQLSEWFKFIYFNSEKEKYDTLSAKSRFTATGETLSIDAELETDIFDGIQELDSTGRYLDHNFVIRILGNAAWMLLLLGFINILIKKK